MRIVFAAVAKERLMPLLAKKTRPGENPKTLIDHTEDVVDSAEALFGTQIGPTRLGTAWLRFFRLDQGDWPTFQRNLLASCLFHDWGKANDGMQGLLNGAESGQLFRHEHLSVLLLGYDGVAQWVKRRSDIDWEVVLAAVGSHHLKFGHDDFASEVPGQATRMRYDHDDFQTQLIPLLANRLDLTGGPTFPERIFWGFTHDIATFDPSDLREALKDSFHILSVACRNVDHPRTRMLRAVRSGLIAADAAGSGLPRTGRHTGWIREQFDRMPVCTERLVKEIVLKRIDHLATAGKWNGAVSWDSDGWNQFQKQCDSLPARSLLLAPCGAGKTLAAWRWITGRVKDLPVKRVLFLYPTRATATEGFKDYVSWAPEADAGLLHGTAGFDLDSMFPAEDPRSGTVFETDPRLFALQHWSKRIFSATVDQFLAFMSYGYGPICLLPLLADSVVVIDEVHSFDRKMFSALLGFLKAFNVPVLAMTATLPEPRQAQLVEAGLYLSNPKPDDLTRIANAPRYRVSRINEAEVRERILEAVGEKEKKRVIWVVNQVSRAQAAVQEMAENLRHSDRLQSSLRGPEGVPVFCYHSRFTLNDRVTRHREVLTAIRAGHPACIAITTQVCEMSLDIDADLLITEECPITSLIQRMGRCRRGRDELAAKGPGEVLVYKSAEEKVYKQDDLDGLTEFLAFVTEREAVSQTELEHGLEQFGPKAAEAPRLNSFLASGAYAIGADDSFRDIEEFNVSAVLNSDIAAYQSAGASERPGYVLPVPKKMRPAADSRLPRYLAVADDRHYHPATGFWDEPLR